MKIVRVVFWEMPAAQAWAYTLQAKGPGRWDVAADVHSASGFDSFQDAARDAQRMEEQIRTGQLVPGVDLPTPKPTKDQI